MIEEMGVNEFLAVTQDLGIDVFLPNYQEGGVLTGLDEPEEIAAALAKLYPQALIMLKLDADGALVYDDGVATHIPPATNNLVDDDRRRRLVRRRRSWPATSTARPRSMLRSSPRPSRRG